MVREMITLSPFSIFTRTSKGFLGKHRTSRFPTIKRRCKGNFYAIFTDLFLIPVFSARLGNLVRNKIGPNLIEDKVFHKELRPCVMVDMSNVATCINFPRTKLYTLPQTQALGARDV